MRNFDRYQRRNRRSTALVKSSDPPAQSTYLPSIEALAVAFEALKISESWKHPLPPLLRLPLEVRENIWTEVLYHERPTRLVLMRLYVSHPVQRPGFLPNCALVSKQFLQEVIQVLIRTMCFKVETLKGNLWFRSFLDSVPGGGRKHVRHLHFDYFGALGRFAQVNRNLALAASCPGLRIIYVTFHKDEIKESIEILSRKEYVKMLLSCKSLAHLIFIFYRQPPRRSGDNRDNASMDKLCAFIKDEFKSRGRDVVVKCETHRLILTPTRMATLYTKRYRAHSLGISVVDYVTADTILLCDGIFFFQCMKSFAWASLVTGTSRSLEESAAV